MYTVHRITAYYKMQVTLYTVTQDKLIVVCIRFTEYKQCPSESAPNDTKPLSLSPRIRISLWAAVSCSISQCQSHNFNHVRVICSSVVTNVWLSKKLPRTWRVVWRYIWITILKSTSVVNLRSFWTITNFIAGHQHLLVVNVRFDLDAIMSGWKTRVFLTLHAVSY